MALNAATTANEIVTAIETARGSAIPAPHRATAVAYWTAIIDALYTRIKADILIQSQVAAGIAGTVTSGAGSPGNTITSATGTATNTSVT